MTHLMILTDLRVARHCTTGTSNKIWSACVGLEQEEPQAISSETLPSTTSVIFLCVHGAYGSTLRQQPPQRLSLQAARALFRKKWQEKAGKGYAPVAFESSLSAFGHPFGLPLRLTGSDAPTPVLPSAPDPGSPPLLASLPPTHATPPTWRQTAALLKDVSYEHLMTMLADTSLGTPSRYAVSEKANGERFMYHQKSPLWAFTAESSEAFL